MSLKNKLLFFLIFYPILGFSLSLPPEFLTKQSLENIRFISDDGKSTYFQRKSGSLHLTQLYNTYELISLPPHTHYQINISNNKKRILVSANKNTYTSNIFLGLQEIYVGDYLAKKISKVAEGVSATLQGPSDDWVSFYVPKNKEIIYKNLLDQKTTFTIKLKNKVNPYFIPETILLNDDQILYSDILPDGSSIIYKLDRRDGQIVAILKSQKPGMKIEICSKAGAVFLGQFGLGDVSYGAQIYQYEIDSLFKLNKSEMIYSSTKNDLGNMICDVDDNHLYFIQAQTKDNDIGIRSTDVSAINLQTKETQLKTMIGDATQIIKMDQRILMPYQGRIYVIKGESNLKEDNLINKNAPKEVTE